ncbi:hypothetical protein AOCH_006249 [Aspergillus ochraceoroseus]|uniref:Uncharacterized protein n=2 Tax=Aspergillus ochraceoroseus TaxID=138278 RepID=A0A0F8UJN8_9EURO|nr:hypothetical protein AOCH_006249 [Aspergillus ochraceoroseus]
MNWTGGRLRRHSETNTKTRKQVFGKSSSGLKAPHHITLFNNLSKAGGHDQKKRKLIQRSNHDDIDQQSSPRSQPSPNSALPIGTDRPSQTSNNLDYLRRQLLETADWGAVAAARPLRMSFTPTEEIERFGKRRKLTTGDRQRLRVPTKPHFKVQKELSSEWGTLDDLEIRINKQPLGVRAKDKDEESHLKNISSQSMLLDHEESACSNEIPELRDSWNSRTGARSISKLSILSNDSKPCFLSSGRESSDIVSNTRASTPTSILRPVKWYPRDSGPQSLWSNGSSSIVPQAKSPVRRRFTIDDQEVADREGRLILSSPAGERSTPLVPCEPPRAYFGFLGRVSETTNDFDRFSNITTDTSPRTIYPPHDWLSEQQKIQQSISKKLTVGPSSLNSEDSSWTPEAKEAMTSPVRIFGQPIVPQLSHTLGDFTWTED